MAPPHLHPRSRMTSSLFATTVFASFFVVVLPHVLPCPAPRVARADGQMAEVGPDGTVQRRRRRRRPQDEVAPPAPVEVERDADGMARFAMVAGDARRTTMDTETAGRRPARACPVPKPGGIVGELLGCKSGAGESTARAAPQAAQTQHEQRLPHAPSLEK